MSWKSKINSLFATKDSESYINAKTKLDKVRDSISDILFVLPDSTGGVVFQKNKWELLPENMGNNVKIIGLDLSENYKVILNELLPNSKVFIHEHVSNYEKIQVIDGEINLTFDNGENIKLVADTNNDSILLNVGEKHEITTEIGARYITAYSTDIDLVEIHEEDVLLAKKF